MNTLITDWLKNLEVPQAYFGVLTISVSVLVLFVICLFIHYLVKHQILVLVQKIIQKSKNKVDDLIFEHKVFSRFALLTPFIVLLTLAPAFSEQESVFQHVLVTFAKIAISFQSARVLSALLNVVKSVFQSKAQERYLPLNSSIQVIKLVIYLVATILAISFVVDRSPLYLLSGLGALTAVLLLVFQDTIKGLVASIQISANKMVAPGDWIEIPKFGADGDVLEIGLNTVKVRNFDRTITTVPTYALISDSFKNWRDMYNSGGRRIKRAITIDISTIKFFDRDEIASLKQIDLLSEYLTHKDQEISAQAKETELPVNNRQLTNVGTFRAYVELYLKQHPDVNTEMTCMVRQLPATATGLPLELYFFSRQQDWIKYEAIQSDIFDHLYAAASLFDLKVFQHPSGADWRHL